MYVVAPDFEVALELLKADNKIIHYKAMEVLLSIF